MNRFGSLLILVGLILLLIFLVSGIGDNGNIMFLFYAGTAMGIGIWLKIRFPLKDQPKSRRFEMLRGLTGKDENSNDETE